jgi:hypothetical protein
VDGLQHLFLVVQGVAETTVRVALATVHYREYRWEGALREGDREEGKVDLCTKMQINC